MSESPTKYPFSIGYVLRTTAKHMRKAIDISIRKTFDRTVEFKDQPEKAKEVFDALQVLHTMRKNLDEFQSANQHLFKGE